MLVLSGYFGLYSCASGLNCTQIGDTSSCLSLIIISFICVVLGYFQVDYFEVSYLCFFWVGLIGLFWGFFCTCAVHFWILPTVFMEGYVQFVPILEATVHPLTSFFGCD